MGSGQGQVDNCSNGPKLETCVVIVLCIDYRSSLFFFRRAMSLILWTTALPHLVANQTRQAWRHPYRPAALRGAWSPRGAIVTLAAGRGSRLTGTGYPSLARRFPTALQGIPRARRKKALRSFLESAKGELLARSRLRRLRQRQQQMRRAAQSPTSPAAASDSRRRQAAMSKAARRSAMLGPPAARGVCPACGPCPTLAAGAGPRRAKRRPTLERRCSATGENGSRRSFTTRRSWRTRHRSTAGTRKIPPVPARRARRAAARRGRAARLGWGAGRRMGRWVRWGRCGGAEAGAGRACVGTRS